MNLYTSICLGITIAGFMGGIIVKVANLSARYGSMREKIAGLFHFYHPATC